MLTIKEDFMINSTKKIGRTRFSLVLTVAVIFLMAATMIPGVMGAATFVDVGSATTYEIVAGTGITQAVVNNNAITGDIGNPAGAAIGVSCPEMNGGGSVPGSQVRSGDAGGPVLCVLPTDATVGTAITDWELAYTNANLQVVAPVIPIAGDISGQTLVPGIYKSGAAVSIPGTVTLDAQGDPNAVWVFQIDGTLTTGAGSKVVLANGAQAKNIFWVVTGYTSLDTTTDFNGNIMGWGYINLNAGAKINGRTLSHTQVTLNGNTMTIPTDPSVHGGPLVTLVKPASGPLAGGNTVIITGSGFTGVTLPTQVTIDGLAVTSVTFDNDGQITAVIPVNATLTGPTGPLDVVVTTDVGTGAGLGLYTYADAPVFVSGETNAAGNVFIITFDKPLNSLAGGDLASFKYQNTTGQHDFSTITLNATVVANTRIDLTTATPVVFGDLVNVSYTNTTGTVTATDGGILAGFTFADLKEVTNNVVTTVPPQLQSATTNSAGTVFILAFDKDMANPAASVAQFTYKNATGSHVFGTAALNATISMIDLTTTSPIVLGDVANVSYTSDGTVTAADGAILATFTDQPVDNNVPTPSVFSSAATNAAGNVFIITFDKPMANPAGLHAQFSFKNATGLHVFSAAALNGTSTSAIDLTTTTPLSVGDVANVSYTSDGSVKADDGGVLATFTDQSVTNNVVAAGPTFTSITPSTGSTLGGTSVVIVGTNFISGGSFDVKIGGVTATDITWNSATQITANTPAGTAGAQPVVLTNNDGQTATGSYTYVAPPTFTSITAISGPLAGGNTVTIAGKDFVALGSFNVTFGGVNATSVTWNSATSITATVPSNNTAGAKDVVIINNDGQTATRVGAYTYAAAPTVTSVAPASGSTAGTNTVTVQGTDFTGATVVNFGVTAATPFTVNSATKITATAPAHAAGLVDVTVTTPGGISATSSSDQYTYVTPETAVVLGIAGNYAILAKTAITTTGTSLVTGDMGISPAAASDTAGFGLSLDPTATYATSSLVTGRVYASDYAGGTTHADLITAVSDMETAYTTANGATPFVTELYSGNLGGRTLAPGVYKFSTGVTIPTDLTLDAQGDSTAVWIFQIAQTLDLAASKHVILSNGAQAKNIFWVVAGTTTLGADSVLNGNVLAGPGASTIALQSGSTLNGRALGQTDVTLISGKITDPTTIATTPTFTSISVSPGPTAGINNVTITGTGFTGPASVTFDGVAATNVSVFSATQINATTPAHAAGAVDVVVTTPLGITTGPAAYTYGDVPVFVSAATNAAGTVITITFDRSMADPAADVGNFDYQINGGAAQTFSTAVLNGDTTTIDLTTSGTVITPSNLITVSYTKGAVTAANGGVLASFAGKSVTNNMYGAAPVVTSAATNAAGTTITLTFNKAMNNPSASASDFKYQINSGGDQSFSTASLNGGTRIDLTPSGTPIAYNDGVTVSYAGITLTAVDSGTLATFAGYTVTNNMPSPTPTPTPTPTITATPAPSSNGIRPSGGDAAPGGSSGVSASAASGLASGQLAPSMPSSVTVVTGAGPLTSTPFIVDFSDMLGVTVSWSTLITGNPTPNARVITAVQPIADSSTRDALSAALHRGGLEISTVAYGMILQKSGMSSSGPTTVTMTVPQMWVDRNGGNDAIRIVEINDDGTVEVLHTWFDRYDSLSGYPVFKATSTQGGLGASFWLMSVIPYTPAPVVAAPESGQMAPIQAPTASTTSGTSTPASGVPLMMMIGGILAALSIVGVATMIIIRRSK